MAYIVMAYIRLYTPPPLCCVACNPPEMSAAPTGGPTMASPAYRHGLYSYGIYSYGPTMASPASVRGCSPARCNGPKPVAKPRGGLDARREPSGRPTSFFKKI